MAERRRRREAGLAGVDVTAVLGERRLRSSTLDLETSRLAKISRAISTRRQDFDISPGHVCSLRDEPLIDQDAYWAARIVMPFLRRHDGFACVQPLDGKIIRGIVKV